MAAENLANVEAIYKPMGRWFVALEPIPLSQLTIEIWRPEARQWSEIDREAAAIWITGKNWMRNGYKERKRRQ